MNASPIILVVDDDEDDRLFIEQSFLDNEGFDCRLEFATDGLKALDWLTRTEQLPTLVLLDMNMPRMNGLDLLRKIRESPRWRGLPVIMFTTSGEENLVTRAYELGINSFIAKPALYSGFTVIMRNLCHYWLHVARVPGHVQWTEHAGR
jgi:CheY-like chemotaxis protein